ncbi:MAG TPA: GtrA family protein [Candidatus Saccharimonadales bacterium]|jgi:putative flippase GtrA
MSDTPLSRPLQFLKAFLGKPFGRYLLIGGLVFLFELLIIFIAQRQGASAVMAVTVSFWAGLVVSFVLTKFITFRDRRTHHRILIPQIAAVALLVLFNFGFTVLVTRLLQDSLPVAASRTLALAVTTIWNFYLYRTRIFKTDDPQTG